VRPKVEPQGVPCFGRNVGALHKVAERITRREREHREQHDADPDEAWDRDDQTSQKITTHAPKRYLRSDGISSAAWTTRSFGEAIRRRNLHGRLPANPCVRRAANTPCALLITRRPA